LKRFVPFRKFIQKYSSTTFFHAGVIMYAKA